MNDLTDLLERAEERWKQVRYLQSLGLICDDGEFVPSVHYPPITQYPQTSPEDLYKTYTLPSDGLLDVYMHFPFCEQHCVFCHYPGMVGAQTEEKKRYISYLKREVALYLQRFGIERITPRAVLIGGGTPTYLEPGQLEDFLIFFNEKIDLSRCRQFNYDVDPGTLVGEDGLKRLQVMKQYGVTRLTIGVQSFDDSVLRCMGRPHDAATAVESIYNAKEYGFDLNIEFIYGHPGETFENWAAVMKKAVTLPTDEIQLYRLKVLAYGDRQGHIINLPRPSFEETMKMKQIAIDILNENGFNENLRRVFTKDKKHISHYAYNQCCNLFDQVGFGITGFSSYRDRFALNPYSFDEYYKSIDENKLPVNRGYIRDWEQQLRWSIVLPLKNMDIKKNRFEKMNGIPFGQVFREKTEKLKAYGLLEETDKIVRLTELGAFVADETAEQFNANEFIPFPRERYADGPLNPYIANSALDLFGYKAGQSLEMSRDEIRRHLLSGGAEQQKLFAMARAARSASFGDALHIRGVVEISNKCVKNCNYCAMRRGNKNLQRFSLDPETIINAARQIADAGISTVFLQSGESPVCDCLLEAVIPKIAETTGCEILLCAGEKERDVYRRYKDAGASSYILKFETSDADLFRDITGSGPEKRLECLRCLKEIGMKTGTGNILGLPGQSIDSLVEDILFAVSLKPDFVSVSPFIANQDTPFENMPNGGIDLTLNIIAVWRLLLPHALIPTVSALEYIHPDGQAAGLNAGANVITVNFTPKQNRDKYAIYAKNRFVVSLAHAEETAAEAGMKLDLNNRGDLNCIRA